MSPFENDDMIGLFASIDVGNDGDAVGGNRNRLPLIGVSVNAECTDFIAEVKISQCYRNSFAKPVEATYNFPIDSSACVCDFVAEYEDGTATRGVIKEKGKAREEYQKATGEGKQASLLESARSDLFTLSVGSLPARGFVKITITYIAYLRAEDHAAALVLPTSIAPRYSPGTERLDAAESKAMALPLTDVKLYGLDVEAKFNCTSSIKTITCPTHISHEKATTKLDGKVGKITLADIDMDRDLVIVVEEERANQPRACVEVSGEGSIAGFVTIFPKIEFRDAAREIVFVVDRSGSMGFNSGIGGKTQIRQASDALLLFLRSLPTSCTFDIVGFGSRHESLFGHPVPFNDETLDTATRYAQDLKSNFGGTNILSPLREIFRRVPPPGRERRVFILTDGQVSNDLEVFNVIRDSCSRNAAGGERRCRLFALGVGANVSRHLVNGMARAGNGTARFVEGADEGLLRNRILGQLKQSLQPALDDVQVEWSFAPEAQEDEGFELVSKPEPEKPAAVKTLLGYRSPSVDEPPPPADEDKPILCPSRTPPVFNGERFLSFVMFPPGSKGTPTSVTIKCNSPDGTLETTIDISDSDLFRGLVAHRMTAREVIREFEEGRKGRHRGGRAGEFRGFAPADDSCPVTESKALSLALKYNLASEQTSFVAVREVPSVEPGSEATRMVIPTHLPRFEEKDRGDSYSQSFARPRRCFLRSAPQSAACLLRSAPLSPEDWDMNPQQQQMQQQLQQQAQQQQIQQQLQQQQQAQQQQQSRYQPASTGFFILASGDAAQSQSASCPAAGAGYAPVPQAGGIVTPGLHKPKATVMGNAGGNAAPQAVPFTQAPQRPHHLQHAYVQAGGTQLSSAVSAGGTTSAGGVKRGRAGAPTSVAAKPETQTKADRSKLVKECNREHAKCSRIRKKFLLESLQQSDSLLKEENEKLKNAIRSHLGDKEADALLSKQALADAAGAGGGLIASSSADANKVLDPVAPQADAFHSSLTRYEDNNTAAPQADAFYSVLTRCEDNNAASRRERNREHAKTTRMRKKFMLESLQQQVQGLQDENSALRMLAQKHIPQKEHTQKIHNREEELKLEHIRVKRAIDERNTMMGGQMMRRQQMMGGQMMQQQHRMGLIIPPEPFANVAQLAKDGVGFASDANEADKARHTKISQNQGDGLMKLCMLQAANGSFAPVPELADAVGLTNEALHKLVSEYTPPAGLGLDGNIVASIIATLVAVTAMKKMFFSQRDIWSLQEGKAMDYVRKQPLPEEEVRHLTLRLDAAL